MKILRTIEDITSFAKTQQRAGKVIGLVPTMGALHQGHLTLMETAKAKCDVVIASVFVNPVQFGPQEDYGSYPRQFAEDCQLLESVGVDAVFHPEPATMYPQGFNTYVNVESPFTKKLCGGQRPGHFRGVATVVTKLLLLSRAEEAFFGQKDAQQVLVLQRMVADLNIQTHINMVPIVREANGLARSSRNSYLTDLEKKSALVLSRSLRKAQAAFAHGESSVAHLKALVKNEIMSEAFAEIDYVELLALEELAPLVVVDQPALLAIAVKIGGTRLIDNVILERK